ncbi:MAG: hypothetical protein LBJ31_12300 [Treponema sp.]|jgi:hypothetical protein|nr:hypothetical protein [Treponema sp.]
MKNRLFPALLGLAVASGLFAQNVDRPELENNQAVINWINYEGPHSRIDTVEQIRAIGLQLGLAIKNGAQRAGANNRYFVIHCVSDVDGDKLDADVFGLGVDVGVDHIRNLRLIIQGYLQGAYDYSAADAAVLARFITVYNAVFRGDWDFFSNRYKNLVVENLSAEKAGISIRFDEWPGQTLMTIPLGTGEPGLSALDTSMLTDSGVIDEMRSADDRGIEDRQGMVDIKEREADEANQSATLQRGVIAEEERDIQRDQDEVTTTRRRVEDQQAEAGRQQQQAEQQRQQAEQQRQEAARRQQEAAEAAEAGRQQEAERLRQEAENARREAEASEQSAAQREQEAERQQEAARRQSAAADQRQQEIDQRQAEQEQRRREADAAQQTADRKTAEAQQERQQIAEDQQALIDQVASASPSAVPGVLAAANLQKGNSLGRLVRVNPATMATIQSSQMNTLNTRTVTMVGNRIIGIAGIQRRNGAVRIVEIDAATLEMLKQGDDDISPNSLLWVNGSSVYAISAAGGKNYLSRFDAVSFAKQAQSSVEVHPYASCLFQGGKVLTQKADGTPLVLDPQSLQ